jgi:hypothetical protein
MAWHVQRRMMNSFTRLVRNLPWDFRVILEGVVIGLS